MKYVLTLLFVFLVGCSSTTGTSHQDLIVKAAIAYAAVEADAVINDAMIEPMKDGEIYAVIAAIEALGEVTERWRYPPLSDDDWTLFQQDYMRLRNLYLGIYLLAMKYWHLYDAPTRDKLEAVHLRYVVIDTTTQGLLTAKSRRDAYQSAKKVGGVVLSILAKG